MSESNKSEQIKRSKQIKYGAKIQIDEVDALIRYTLEHNLDPKGSNINKLCKEIDKWGQGQGINELPEAVLSSYAQLVAKTKGVTGRTILDSERSWYYLLPLVLVTILFVALATTHGLVAQMYNEIPSSGDPYGAIESYYYLLNYLSPFIWGVLGSCVYLLKRLYDIATNLQFDAVLFRGWWVRLVLGGVLGSVVAEIFMFDGSASGADVIENTLEHVEFSITAVAFLTGLGVRVVYGALERTIDVLAEKIGVNNLRNRSKQDARSLITEYLSKLDADQYPEKYAALLDVLQSYGNNSNDEL